MVFGAGVSGVSAAKSGAIISGQLPVSISDPTPASTVISNPTPVNVASGAAPISAAGDNPVATTGDTGASGNSSATTGDNATVSVSVIVCPTNYNTFYAINDFNKATTDCTGAPHNVPIHLIDDSGDSRVLVNGRVTWHNVVPGKVYIKGEDDPTVIQPFTWCQVNGSADYIQGAIIDDSLYDLMLPNQSLNCLWFVTPMHKRPIDGLPVVNGGVLAPPTDATPVAAAGTLTLNGLSACPAGFDAASADIYGLAANCHDPAPAYAFMITDSSGAQKSSQDGIASFGAVSAGALTASIQLPSGWAAPRVFCKSQQGDAEQEAAVSGNGWTVNILSGQDAYCDVINIPAATSGQSGATVISDASFCYDGMLNGNYSHANLANNCFPDPNVTITAVEGNQLIGQATTANGVATISGIPAGVVRLQGHTPETGVIHVLVYCNVSGVGNDQLINSAGGLIQLSVTDGETTNCSWFFITPGYPLAG
ncbi:MAG: hypothetical protein J0H25_08880 [Rhizobiales bacterium]|nr:hypothetical protein [Hyphomicrobiales bacterium]